MEESGDVDEGLRDVSHDDGHEREAAARDNGHARSNENECQIEMARIAELQCPGSNLSVLAVNAMWNSPTASGRPSVAEVLCPPD